MEGGDTATCIRGLTICSKNRVWGFGKRRPIKNWLLNVQKLWKEVSFLRELSQEHVKAHRGHRWNGNIDHLAFRAMQGKEPLPLQFGNPVIDAFNRQKVIVTER